MRILTSAVLLLLLVASPAQATRLPHIFGDHMVLQAGQPVPVWGWGDPGERVIIAFQGQRVTAVTGTDGRWRATLKPLRASAVPSVFTVTGKDRLTASDVLVGQVWLGSGQSNMEKPIGAWPGQRPTEDYQQALAAANVPTLRLFQVADDSANAPRDDVKGEWVVTTPDALDRIKFSAVGYFFGRKLTQTLNQPVGMIDSSIGGTRIERWTSPAAFAAYPSLAGFAKAAATPGNRFDGETPSGLYNAMIAPLAPFAMAGVIWYQGEANITNGDSGALYADKQRALVAGWRKAFDRQLPFYVVQIAPYRYSENPHFLPVTHDTAADLRGGQVDAARTVPDSGIVITSDLVADLSDIHPADKRSVGLRLANLALAEAYGVKGIETRGPEFAGLTIDGGKAMVRFTHAEGLRTRGGDPSGFTLAGADGVFWPAGSATIVGDAVVVSTPRVPAPIAVRMGWSDAMNVNLENTTGLPAVSFASDRR